MSRETDKQIKQWSPRFEKNVTRLAIAGISVLGLFAVNSTTDGGLVSIAPDPIKEVFRPAALGSLVRGEDSEGRRTLSGELNNGAYPIKAIEEVLRKEKVTPDTVTVGGVSVGTLMTGNREQTAIFTRLEDSSDVVVRKDGDKTFVRMFIDEPMDGILSFAVGRTLDPTLASADRVQEDSYDAIAVVIGEGDDKEIFVEQPLVQVTDSNGNWISGSTIQNEPNRAPGGMQATPETTS